MVEITDIDWRRCYISQGAIAAVSEADAASQWRGIRSHIRMFDGRLIGARDTADEIVARMAKDAEAR